MSKIKCPICNTEIEDKVYTECPICCWGYTGIENTYEENEYDSYNLTTQRMARENYKKGLNIWGEPLPKE